MYASTADGGMGINTGQGSYLACREEKMEKKIVRVASAYGLAFDTIRLLDPFVRKELSPEEHQIYPKNGRALFECARGYEWN